MTIPATQELLDKSSLCTTLMRDACVSRLEIEIKRDPRSVKLYEQFYSRWGIALYYLFTVVNLCTALLEQPATITFNGRPLPFYVPLTINFVCELYFYYRVYLIYSVTDNQRRVQRGIVSHISIIILLLMLIDGVMFGIMNAMAFNYVIRWSRCLRPILLLTFPESRRLRAAFSNIRSTAFDVLPVFAMFIASVLFLSIVTLTLVGNLNLRYPNGKPYFTDILDVAWQLYVLTTTANSPDVIIPAYEHHRAFIIIYIVGCGLCNWMFMGILTASVYNSYKSHLGRFVTTSVALRKLRLDEAFKLACQPCPPTNENGIIHETFVFLLRRAKPHMSQSRIDALYHILDKDRTGYLQQNEFGRLAEYMQAKLIEVDLSRKHFTRYVPFCHDLFVSRPFQLFRRVVRHWATHGFFTLLVLSNAVTAVVLRPYPKVQNLVEWVYTGAFTFELIINYAACGGVQFWAEKWNIFDLLVVIGALSGQIVHDTLVFLGYTVPPGITQMMLMLRIFRILKLFSAVPRFRVVINCILTIMPSLTAYTSILLIFFYIYACVGMELFANLFREPAGSQYAANATCYNPNLANTDYVGFHYCVFNFNTVADAFLLLLVVTVGNNWNIFSEGHTSMTSQWSNLFFAVIQWTCVLLVLNIVLAFIIEAFLIEFDAQHSRFEGYVRERLHELNMDAELELEKRGLADYGKPGFFLTRQQLDDIFPVGSAGATAFLLQTDSTSIEILMFRMFENEIEELLEVMQRKSKQYMQAHDVYKLF